MSELTEGWRRAAGLVETAGGSIITENPTAASVLFVMGSTLRMCAIDVENQAYKTKSDAT